MKVKCPNHAQEVVKLYPASTSYRCPVCHAAYCIDCGKAMITAFYPDCRECAIDNTLSKFKEDIRNNLEVVENLGDVRDLINWKLV